MSWKDVSVQRNTDASERADHGRSALNLEARYDEQQLEGVNWKLNLAFAGYRSGAMLGCYYPLAG